MVKGRLVDRRNYETWLKEEGDFVKAWEWRPCHRESIFAAYACQLSPFFYKKKKSKDLVESFLFFFFGITFLKISKGEFFFKK